MGQGLQLKRSWEGRWIGKSNRVTGLWRKLSGITKAFWQFYWPYPSIDRNWWWAKKKISLNFVKSLLVTFPLHKPRGLFLIGKSWQHDSDPLRTQRRSQSSEPWISSFYHWTIVLWPPPTTKVTYTWSSMCSVSSSSLKYRAKTETVY